MIRQPAVADRFYPGNREALSRAVADLMARPIDGAQNQSPGGRCSPCRLYLLRRRGRRDLEQDSDPRKRHPPRPQPSRRGGACRPFPYHLGHAHGECADQRGLGRSSAYPTGPRSSTMRSPIASNTPLEVQVPFLQALQPKLSLVPIVLSHISYQLCEEVAASIVQAVRETSGRGADCRFKRYDPL